MESSFLTYCDEDGLFADFHANRHTFITNLGRAGVTLKEAQTLARHSDVNLTMGIYSHVGVSDQAAAGLSMSQFSSNLRRIEESPDPSGIEHVLLVERVRRSNPVFRGRTWRWTIS